MDFYQVKDMVREHFGRIGLPTSILEIALAESRRMIEREANFWWMRGIANFNLVASTTSYLIGSGLAIDIANFKDARALQQKISTATRWEPVELGIIDEEDLNLMYDNDDAGEPEYAVIDNVTLKVYPPLPDLAYNMRLYYYKWTDNPGANTSTTDDLIKNYGSALCYGALIWAFEIELKDIQGAAYWRNLLGGTPFGRGGEIARLKRENFKRDWKDRTILVPFKGTGRLTRRSLTNLQIYCR